MGVVITAGGTTVGGLSGAAAGGRVRGRIWVGGWAKRGALAEVEVGGRAGRGEVGRVVEVGFLERIAVILLTARRIWFETVICSSWYVWRRR